MHPISMDSFVVSRIVKVDFTLDGVLTKTGLSIAMKYGNSFLHVCRKNVSSSNIFNIYVHGYNLLEWNQLLSEHIGWGLP